MEDGRSPGETPRLLLATAGREPFDAAAVRGDGTADLCAAAADRVILRLPLQNLGLSGEDRSDVRKIDFATGSGCRQTDKNDPSEPG
jgi:hypothetical protein